MSITITKPLDTKIAPSYITSGCWGTIANWLEEISTATDGALVGVDIFHKNGFDDPDEAEVCVGYAARSGQFYATTQQFSAEAVRIYRLVYNWVFDSRLLTSEVFEALDWNASVVGWDEDDLLADFYTLVTRNFTIAYTYDRTLPFSESASTVCATLVLHDRLSAANAPILLQSLNACLAELTSVHDVLKNVRFQVPTLSEILAAS
ncbi:hypothetical protein [Amaricoccus macauensis]|uniref:hypothetical protein n=1 Tax=Amaricoccus macauensis TaxID=57001 RepID=UPI003C7CAB8B